MNKFLGPEEFKIYTLCADLSVLDLGYAGIFGLDRLLFHFCDWNKQISAGLE